MADCDMMGQPVERVRPMAVAGQFYPADKKELLQDLKVYFSDTKQTAQDKVRAVIVPHAGYVYSGAVAATAYAQLHENASYEHVFLLGPSHRTSMNGASICTAYDCYETPLGKLRVDKALAQKLVKEHKVFTYVPVAHGQEHCLEVQLPFLQYRLQNLPPIVPIIIGTEDYDILKKIAHALEPYFNDRNLFVISSDFSHYPSYKEAYQVDRVSGDAIVTGKLDNFLEAIWKNHQRGIRNLYTSACGQSAIVVLMQMMEDTKEKLDMKHLMYKNSGDSPYGDKDQVVGYHSFVLTKDMTRPKVVYASSADEAKPFYPSAEVEEPQYMMPEESEDGFTITKEEKKALLNLARATICKKLGLKNDPSVAAVAAMDESHLPVFQVKTGAFVTLMIHGSLRGCIGHFGEDMALKDVVREMALAAAFEDPRFRSVRAVEMDDIKIEISVLTPLKRIYDVKDFHYGREGIYMQKGYRSGTFLPQVADEVDWTKEEFLGHCAQDKAGLGWNGWKDAELYTYEAIIFHE